MNRQNSIFFWYCTACAVFLAASGAATFLKSGNPLLVLFFAPILGYFVYNAAQQLFTSKPIPMIGSSKQSLAMIGFFFIVLIGLALYMTMITPRKPPSQLKTPAANVRKPSPTPQYGTVSGLEQALYVNIREKPSQQSKSLQKARESDRFVILGQQDKWVNVRLQASASGWIHQDFITVSNIKRTP